MSKSASKDKKNVTARSGNVFVRSRASQSNTRLLQILTTKPEPTISERIYKRLDEWPGIRPLNLSRMKSLSTKSMKQPLTEKSVHTEAKYIKPFGRVTLFGDTLSLIPSSHSTVRHKSTEKILPPTKRSTELMRMDRYEDLKKAKPSVQQVIEDQVVKDQLRRNYRIDFESFNYIDKIIDFKDLWRDYVRKTVRPE